MSEPRSVLSRCPARPRRRRPQPHYPRLAVVGVALTIGASCEKTPAQSASDSTAVAVVIPTPSACAAPQTAVAPPSTSSKAVTPHFAVDVEPLDAALSCRGDCPPPFELATRRKDRRQIEARIQHCFEAHGGSDSSGRGTVTATAAIGADGKATTVEVERTGKVAYEVVSCVQRLVESAPFSSEHALERTSAASSSGVGDDDGHR